MARFLFPSEYYDSTYSIDFASYYSMGYRAVLFDIDNTLVPHNAMSDERSQALMQRLKDIGFKICLVSNNKYERVNSFNEYLQVEFIWKAGKPKPDGYIKAMKMMGVRPGNTLFVGDQLFTDIWGANNARIHSILVKPINKKEEIQIILKRRLERPIIWLYCIKHPCKTAK